MKKQALNKKLILFVRENLLNKWFKVSNTLEMF